MIRGLPRQLLSHLLIRVKILSVEANTADRAPRMALASLAFAPARHAPAHHRAGTSPDARLDVLLAPRGSLTTAVPSDPRVARDGLGQQCKNFAIEVERKYDASVVSVDALTQTVESLGGETKGVVTFTDVYYDTPDASLAAKDTWLRARDGAWEIKVPLSQGDDTAPRSGGERSVFREVEGPGACLHELNAALLGAPPAHDVDDARTKNDLDAEAALIAAMKTLDVHPFAKFTTERAKFASGRSQRGRRRGVVRSRRVRGRGAVRVRVAGAGRGG